MMSAALDDFILEVQSDELIADPEDIVKYAYKEEEGKSNG